MYWGEKYEELEPLYIGKLGELLQFFTAVKDDIIVATFPVNHQDFPSATSYIVACLRDGIDVTNGGYDYVRSATRKEAAAYREAYRERQQKDEE